MDAIVEYLPLLIPVFILELGLAVFALINLAKRSSVNYLPKIVWALIIIFIGILGPISYFILRGEENE